MLHGKKISTGNTSLIPAKEKGYMNSAFEGAGAGSRFSSKKNIIPYEGSGVSSVENIHSDHSITPEALLSSSSFEVLIATKPPLPKRPPPPVPTSSKAMAMSSSREESSFNAELLKTMHGKNAPKETEKGIMESEASVPPILTAPPTIPQAPPLTSTFVNSESIGSLITNSTVSQQTEKTIASTVARQDLLSAIRTGVNLKDYRIRTEPIREKKPLSPFEERFKQIRAAVSPNDESDDSEEDSDF